MLSERGSDSADSCEVQSDWPTMYSEIVLLYRVIARGLTVSGSRWLSFSTEIRDAIQDC